MPRAPAKANTSGRGTRADRPAKPLRRRLTKPAWTLGWAAAAGSWEEPHVRAENLRLDPAAWILAGDQRCLWLVFPKTWCRASWLREACFCIIHHSESSLQLEEKLTGHSQWSPSLPPLLCPLHPFLKRKTQQCSRPKRVRKPGKVTSCCKCPPVQIYLTPL